jgi:hypothetical protein
MTRLRGGLNVYLYLVRTTDERRLSAVSLMIYPAKVSGEAAYVRNRINATGILNIIDQNIGRYY